MDTMWQRRAASLGVVAVCLLGVAELRTAPAWAAPVEYVKVCDAFGTGYFYIPGTETCLKASAFVGSDSVFIGDQTGAFTEVGPPDVFFLQPSSHLHGWDTGADFAWGGANWAHRFQFGYAVASADLERTEPYGGAQTGFVPGSSTYGDGWSLGTYGAYGSQALDYHRFNLTYSQTKPVASGYHAGFKVSLQTTDLSNQGHLESTYYDNYSFDVDQSLKGWFFSAGPTVSVSYPLGGGFRLWAGADAQIGIKHSRFTSWENVCFPCGAPIMIDLDGDRTSLGASATLQGGVALQLGDGFSVKGLAGVTIANRDVLYVRKTSDDADTGIHDQTGTDWSVRIRMERNWP